VAGGTKLHNGAIVSMDMDRVAHRSPGPLIAFFVTTFAISWPCFSSAANPFLLYLGIFAPALVAIGVTRLAEGTSGVIALLERLFKWQVAARWYLFAVGYMAVIKLSVALIYRLLEGRWPPFGTEPWYVIVAATLASTFIGGQAGEEIGWRGYALPQLASRFGFAAASVILGLIWALWHLPLFFIAGADKQGQSFIVYTVQVVAISVAIAWVYLRSGGSLLLTMLMHSAINQSKDIVPSVAPGAFDVFSPRASVTAWLTAALLWILTAVLLPRMKESS
jgi:membrane protease YdiL (CAAX protease family)